MNKRPELFFENDLDDWKTVNIGEECNITIGEFVIKTLQNDNSKYPVYNGGTTYTGFYDKWNETGKKVIISARGAAGFVNKCETNYWAGNSCYSLDPKGMDWEFLYYSLKNLQEDLIRSQQSANIPAVSKAQVQAIDIYAPDIPTQQKISRLLNNIDLLINNKEKELTKISNFRHSMFNKMFPICDHKIPDLRFDNYNDNWNNISFGKIFDKLTNNSFSRDLLNYKKGKVKNIHYGDILIKFDYSIDVNNELVPFINEDVKVSNFKGKDYLRTCDVVFSDTAEDTTAGKMVEIINENGIPVISGLHTYACRPNIEFYPGYLGLYFNTDQFHDQLLKYMQGTKVTGFNYEYLCRTVVSYPSYEEQKSIVNYFSTLNELVHNIEIEIEKLKKLQTNLQVKLIA